MFKKISKWLITITIISLLPTFAFAQSIGPFTVNDSDISLKILAQLFGSLIPNGGKDAFGNAINTFNAAVLIVGGILATYTLLAGTLGTAHDGEMLGKKFSSVWIPIRYSLGTALVLPVLSGGYCIMQQLVMWCIIQGIGLANAVWTSYLSSPNLTVPVYMTTNHKKAVLNFANNVALAQICTQANASILNEGGTGGGLIDKIAKSVMTFNYSVAYSDDNSTVYFGDQAGKLSLITRYNCGFADLPKKPSNAQVITPTSASSGGKLGDISSAFTLGDVSPIYQAHIDQSKKLITKMGELAKKAVDSDSVLNESDVEAAANEYIVGVESAANTYSNGDNSPFAGIINASKEQGWILAGSWFTKLAMMNKTLDDAVNSIPTASATYQLGSSFKFLDAVQPKISTARTSILESMHVSLPDNNSDEKDDAKGKQTESSSLWSKLVQEFVQMFTGLDLEKIQNTDKHPLLVLQDAGDRLLFAWSMGLTALGGGLALTAVKIMGTGFDAAPIVITFIGFLFAPLTVLVGLGFTLAYLLPNLPFLMWIGIVLGWLIMCIEAILAAPLWAVMHLHPNGDDLTGRGGNGYMLLLGLLLRPALTIFGLIAALVLTELMGEFVNKIFFSVFHSGNGSGLITILSVIFSLTVYTTAMVQLFRKTFSLMHVIPDQLLRWIGGGQEQMGQYAGGLAEAGQKGVQAASQTGSFLGERTGQTAGQMINQYQYMKDKEKQNQARKETIEQEKTAQNQIFYNAGMTPEEVNKMNSRTEKIEKTLDSVNPNSLQGIVLSNSQNKMLKARSEGDSKVRTSVGHSGRLSYLKALSSGEYKTNSGEIITIGSFGDTNSNDFEREAIFANFVANDIITNHASKLNNNENERKQDVGTNNTNNSVTQSGSTENQFTSVKEDSFINYKNNDTNIATQTDMNGNPINPVLAETTASSGQVNPFGKGLTNNAQKIIQNGGINPNQSRTNINENMNSNISTESQITDFTTQSKQFNNTSEETSFTKNTDTNEQFLGSTPLNENISTIKPFNDFNESNTNSSFNIPNKND